MGKSLNFHIERLPEGFNLATSKDIAGLVAQGVTVIETLEIARDVAKKLREIQTERSMLGNVALTENSSDFPSDAAD